MSLIRSLLVVASAVAVTAVTAPAAAQQPVIITQPAALQYAYTLNDLNLREGPGTSHPIIAVMPQGSEVSVYECLSPTTWCYVGWQGYEGWASASYLTLIAAPAPVIVTPPPQRRLFPRFGPLF